ncbi:alpha/beta fold hydrolase [Arthrobacter koreensis]|uniref:alpha/beta fold hydrolase n=1 Tax=Arthrobacter koreensis TaxID=199136 RepID=UPI0036DE9531
MNTTTIEQASIWTALREVAFSQQYLDVDGTRTRVVTAGDRSNPALVMLHGTGGHWETFSRIIGPLSEHFYCVAYDMIGNGFSDKPDRPYDTFEYVAHLKGVLAELGIERTNIMGSSLGSWVAARFALENPDRTERVILVSPAGLIASAENMARIIKERTRAVNEASWESISAVFNHLIADEENRIPDLIALRLAIYRRQDTRDTVHRMLTLQQDGVRQENLLSEEQWRSIESPTLVVLSGKDHREYETTARRVLEMLPHARELAMPHVAHWAAFEDPETFVVAAVPFLKGE